MDGASGQETTASSSTSHIREILRLTPSGISRLERQTMASGWMPTWRRAATECWVGLVFSSPDGPRYGTSDTCRKKTFSRPTSRRTWRAASRNGSDSMSPTVPPISWITMSTSSVAMDSISSLISLVMCGITCTVSPRKSPRRSLAITFEYTLPVVTLASAFRLTSRKRS